MAIASCQLCNRQQWQTFSDISFGIWEESSTILFRQNSVYPLSKCKHCGHVQISSEYTPALFEKLYFHSTQEAVMWHETLVGDNSPYEEMIDFALNDSTPKTVVDFGCGEGKLLAAANKRLPDSTLVGIDFNDRFSEDNIHYLSFDLNNLAQLPNQHWPEGIDLAMASHVLEHVINPVNFLQHIKQQLSPNGAVFIEVPDFSQHHTVQSIGMSNLVNLQHIHYYTADSITFAAKRAGFKVVKISRITTGYIPRLQVLLTPDEIVQSHPSSSLFDAANVIKHYQAQCRQLRANLADALRESISRDGKVGIWGVGADFYNLMTEHADINDLIKQGNIVLFDYALKDRILQQQPILCSSQIPSAKYTVFMSPQLAETRIKMRSLSQDWHDVVDPFYTGND
jgi:SAM-dependent methyltransferase